ncbi:PAAR domain-containing protein [Burkholderia sp. WSM2232]|uniref:PAAR domain-containing protein n=1 Tax=Burkholderia sp. WSM2232 TaxID=944436 RepID=UPI0018DC1998|nr:PAAR domain-containing protein [Burkholderia sp. WSM2232]
MFDRLAADGDRTTTGGQIMAYSDFFNEGGKAYARSGNKATCGYCKGAWEIAGTATGWMNNGDALVRDMDWVLCPCGKNRVLAASGSNAFYSENEERYTVEQTPKAFVYDQQYTLKDTDGQPLSNVRYRVSVGSAVVASGTTDSGGRTQRIATEDARRLTLEIIGAV